MSNIVDRFGNSYNQVYLSDYEKIIRQKKSVLIELKNSMQDLTKKDIGKWHQAWQMAINPENPARVSLYDIYLVVLIDLHLTGCISQRMNMVKSKSFKLVSIRESKENRELTEIFEAQWFKDFCDYTLESRYWGHSLIQLGNIVTVDGQLRYDNVELVDRRHVVPEYGVITKEAGDDWQRGYSYRSGQLANWVVEVGKPKDLGLLLKLSPQALSKKNMLAYWDNFGEMFGAPIRIGKTTSRDKNEQLKMENMLANMGAMAWGLFPEGTELEIVETTRGDAFNVYDKRIDRCNSEMSKGTLNQTMTIDSGASYSQSEVHLEVFENVIAADADFLRDTINDKLLPLMLRHGFPVAGHRFDWDEAIEYTPQQQMQIEQMILNSYDVDPQYFVDKYNIQITGTKKTEALRDDKHNFFQ